MECAQRFMQLIVPKRVSTEQIQQIQDELMQKLTLNLPKLDKKYISEILTGDDSKVAQCLWELIVINHLTECSDIIDVDHIDSGPDWLITMKDGTSYYVEATCVGMPDKHKSPEIHRVLEEMRKNGRYTSDTKLICEIRTQVSSVIDRKLKAHAPFMSNKTTGYIMFVSYGNPCIPPHCDLFMALRAIYPFDNLSIDICHSASDITLASVPHYPFADSYQKTNGAKISTNILGNSTYKWLSSIIISGTHMFNLLNTSGAQWSDNIDNDFVLALNPVATYRLSPYFNTATQCMGIDNGQPVTQGREIFPSF